MGTLLRFPLHGAGTDAYRDAYAILARLGFDRLDAPPPGLAAGSCRGSLPAAAIGAPVEDPAALVRAAFVALHDARLRPVAVTGCRLEPVASA